MKLKVGKNCPLKRINQTKASDNFKFNVNCTKNLKITFPIQSEG